VFIDALHFCSALEVCNCDSHNYSNCNCQQVVTFVCGLNFLLCHKTDVKKSRVLGHSGDYILYNHSLHLWDLSMELVSYTGITPLVSTFMR
jgi:hypothetical protein